MTIFLWRKFHTKIIGYSVDIEIIGKLKVNRTKHKQTDDGLGTARQNVAICLQFV